MIFECENFLESSEFKQGSPFEIHPLYVCPDVCILNQGQERRGRAGITETTYNAGTGELGHHQLDGHRRGGRNSW